jgi:hypothetical protein
VGDPSAEQEAHREQEVHGEVRRRDERDCLGPGRPDEGVIPVADETARADDVHLVRAIAVLGLLALVAFAALSALAHGISS